MQTKDAVIHGYKVELELYDEGGEARSDCTVRTWDGQFFDSLETLVAFGELTDMNDQPMTVAPATIAAIKTWADSNGY